MRLSWVIFAGAALAACAAPAAEEADSHEAALGSCSQARTTSALNLRLSPENEGISIKTMLINTIVDIKEIIDGWARVRSGGDEGWAKLAFLACSTDPAGPALSTMHVDDASIRIDGNIDVAWANAPATSFTTDWAGNETETTTTVRALWSERALYMLWELENTGLNVDASRPVSVERDKLYEEDCVELFLAPNPAQRKKYFEIEIGPLGHFFDLSIDRERNTSDASWSSKPEIKTQTDPETRHAVIEVALRGPDILKVLKRGASLPVNMFRMEGKGTRQYLAWSPTRTPRPNFHVPEAFGTLVLE